MGFELSFLIFFIGLYHNSLSPRGLKDIGQGCQK